MTEQKIYTAYDPPPTVQLTCTEKTLTRQSEAAACDINNIIKRFHKTGVLPIDQRDLFFEDVSQMTTYHDALNQIHTAQHAFMQLPAALRMKFDNDAATFLDFASNADNRDEMRELGLLEPLEQPPEPPDPPDPPAPDPGPTPPD